MKFDWLYSFKFKCLLSFISGLFFTLGFAPFAAWYAALAGICLLFWIVDSCKKVRHILLYCLLFGYGHFMSSLYWFINPLLLDIKAFLYAVPITVLVIPTLLSLYIALVGLISFCVKNRDLKIIMFASSWVVVEFIRGNFLLPFPWNFAGYITWSLPVFMQGAKIISVYGLSYIVILIALLPMMKSRVLISCTIAIGIMLSIYGDLQLSNYPKLAAEKKLDLRMLHSNFIPILKISEEARYERMDKLIEATFNDFKQGIDLVIIPEGAMPFPYVKEGDIEFLLEDLATFYRTNIMIATDYFEHNSDNSFNLYNATVMIEPDKKQFYYKNILVPFGEYMPLKKWLTFLDKFVQSGMDFTPGQGVELFYIKDFKFYSPICYEILFPQLFVDAKDMDFIVNVSNDGWFGDSIQQKQHLAMAKFRAIESGKMLIRVTNFGFTSIVNPIGQTMLEAIPSQDITSYDFKLPIIKDKAYGYLPIYGSLSIACFVIVLILFWQVVSYRYKVKASKRAPTVRQLLKDHEYV